MRRGGSLLYATNFSIGVQLLFELARTMSEKLKDSGYQFSIAETHHKSAQILALPAPPNARSREK